LQNQVDQLHIIIANQNVTEQNQKSKESELKSKISNLERIIENLNFKIKRQQETKSPSHHKSAVSIDFEVTLELRNKIVELE
jgi:hypothetical protein